MPFQEDQQASQKEKEPSIFEKYTQTQDGQQAHSSVLLPRYTQRHCLCWGSEARAYSSPVPAAVNPRFTNLPPNKVHNLILPTALKEKQNQFQNPSSVSLAIKPILLKNELQDEKTLHVHNASSEQRSHSTSSFRSDAVLQSCQLDKDQQTCCSCSQMKNERSSTGKREAEGKELMLCREYSLGAGGVEYVLLQHSAGLCGFALSFLNGSLVQGNEACTIIPNQHV